MIIIGHPWIPGPTLHRVYTTEQIKQTPPGSVVLLEPLIDTHDLARYCMENAIAYAVVVTSLEEAIFANALQAKYAICDEVTALSIQPIANEYLFDMRILVPIKDDKVIAKIAKSGIDGVIFSSAIR